MKTKSIPAQSLASSAMTSILATLPAVNTLQLVSIVPTDTSVLSPTAQSSSRSPGVQGTMTSASESFTWIWIVLVAALSAPVEEASTLTWKRSSRAPLDAATLAKVKVFMPVPVCAAEVAKTVTVEVQSADTRTSCAL